MFHICFQRRRELSSYKRQKSNDRIKVTNRLWTLESAGQSWIKSLTAPAEAGDFIAGEALFETNGALPIWFQTPVIIDMLTALVNAESSTAAF